MKIVKWLTPFFALIAVLSFSTFAHASSRTAFNPHDLRISSDTSDLLPDPSAYCMQSQNTLFQTQQLESGWQVAFQNVIGDSYQNDWGCQYLIQATIPTPFDGGDSFTLPPFNYTMPIDWNNMCNQQYPGAHAEWIPGPETGVDGAPWGCVGAPGVIYDPAEQYDGTHLVISGG